MTDVSVAIRSLTAHSPVQLSRPTVGDGSGQVGFGSALVLPRKRFGPRIARWMASVLSAVRTDTATEARPHQRDRRYHHPRREAFMADAAMAREMLRL
jgi:hypothetical protein